MVPTAQVWGTDVLIPPDQFEKDLVRHFRRGLAGIKDRPSQARWATIEEITTDKWRFGTEAGMVFLGYRNGVRVGRKDDRHLVTVGGARAGKGESLIVPNLLSYEGSVLAIDPKGELAKLTAKPRAKRYTKDCFVLDPFAVSGHASARFNPLAEIPETLPDRPNEKWPTAIDDALMIADAMIVSTREDSHWSDSAKTLLQGLVLWALLLRVDNEDNLITVRNFLTLKDKAIMRAANEGHGGDREKALFAEMMLYTDEFNGMVSSIGAQFASMGEKERAGILSEARTQTAWLDSPAVQATLTASDFELADLKRKPTTVYLCLPASNMGTHAKWLRTVIALALRACEREGNAWLIPRAGAPLPVLFVLDEFAVLGHMKSIQSAAGQMAGFGVKLWTILQDLSQLQANYKDSWETFFGNASLVTFHGVSDMTTLKNLSERLGTRSFKMETKTDASNSALVGGAPTDSESIRAEPLMATHELEFALARERMRMVVLFTGSHPLILQRTRYHKDSFFLERMQ